MILIKVIIQLIILLNKGLCNLILIIRIKINMLNSVIQYYIRLKGIKLYSILEYYLQDKLEMTGNKYIMIYMI